MSNSSIHLRGVRVHNLKEISLSIPLGRLTVITGVSGSGKSSLAFDTLYAEGGRRYLETLSLRARRYLDLIERPDADLIENVPPAIAIRQEPNLQQQHATVATASEVADYLALVFTHAGIIVCPECGGTVTTQTPLDAELLIRTLPAGTRFQIAFPSTHADDASIERFEALLRQQGFHRVIVAGKTVRLDAELPEDIGNIGDVVWVIVDRLTAGKSDESRIAESLETAFEHGEKQAVVLTEQPAERAAGTPTATLDGKTWSIYRFDTRLCCPACEIDFAPPTPQLFSFRSPHGACPTCHGKGQLAETAQKPTHVCPDCEGARLNHSALAVRVADRNYAELCRLPLERLAGLLGSLPDSLDSVTQFALQHVWEPLQTKLDYLQEVGLGYLSLDRPLESLSTGEAQRVLLTTALGSHLVNALYVLDEPSAGLHPRDGRQVIESIVKLRDAGNTVVVVEHDGDFIRAADAVIDLGPGAGRQGGEVLFHGTPNALEQTENSPTADYLAGRIEVDRSVPPRAPDEQTVWLQIDDVCHHNLRHVHARFPLNRLTAVVGVSGAGKSSLVEQTLYPALRQALGQTADGLACGSFAQLSGAESIDEVLLVDQRPLSRSLRSNAATYLKFFTEIRQTFAETHDARLQGYSARSFSFNSTAGGRCTRCQGSGLIEIDMQFLSTVTMTCPECQGTRYQPQMLQVKYRDRSIAEVLAMTVDEAFPFFRGQPRVQRRLKCLKDVGLGYLPLGQPAATLSGGEAQRLKLAGHLAAGTGRHVLFLFDEPTRGLHAADVAVLLRCFHELVGLGHSMIVIEHDRQVIDQADWMVELGPDAGEQGGQIVFTGLPSERPAEAGG